MDTLSARMGTVTTVIPTRDEEIHIARCIASVASLGPVVVADSGSTDRTKDIALARGAQFYVRPWAGYAAHKNWAITQTGIVTDWILLLDADEYLTPQGVETIRRALEDRDTSGYYLARRNYFLGRELKHAWWYPDYQLRLFRVGAARYEDRAVHEHMIVEGRAVSLSVDIHHENLKGLDAFVRRHVRYALLEAQEVTRPSHGQRKGTLGGNWADRRRFLKQHVWSRVPGRPGVRFFWLYVVKRGFLDGRPGLIYCVLIAWYDFLIDAMTYELRRDRDSG